MNIDDNSDGGPNDFNKEFFDEFANTDSPTNIRPANNIFIIENNKPSDNIYDSQSTAYLSGDLLNKLSNKIPWPDKYRPKKLKDIVQQDEIINVLKKSFITGSLPHLLLHGPPGTGKTSTILSFAMELYGPNIFNKRVIELNASDERGINVVRNKIITFAKGALGNNDPNYPCPPYKIIILDEADSMTLEAQSALRAVMESLSSITRFCFICNYVNQIIEPIASRCVKFRYKPIENNIMLSKLTNIMKKEKFMLDNEILDKVLELAKGDIRSGIITLQSLKYIYDYKTIQHMSVTLEDIYETTNYIRPNIIENIWHELSRPDTNILTVQRIASDIIKQCFPLNIVLDKLINIIIRDKLLPDKIKGQIAQIISDTEKKLLDGANEYIQIFNVCASVHQMISETRLD
jgi:replication factor C subunit 2/4